MKKFIPEVLAGMAIGFAVLLIFHQKYIHRFWFDFRDAWHHESVEAILVAGAIGLLLGKYLSRDE
jgi:uncharacterized membrane protein SpoIIM required for sporulation